MEDPQEIRDATTAAAVAEATDASPDDVVAHIRQLRAEAAFRAPDAVRSSPLPWIGLGALIVSGSVTYWRLHRDGPALPSSKLVVFPSTMIVRKDDTKTPAMSYIQEGVSGTPPGFRVNVVGQRIGLASEEYSADHRALPYDVVRESLSHSGEALVDELERREGPSPSPESTRYRTEGGTFSPRKGFVRLSISGWAGDGAEWIPLPLTDPGRSLIRRLAVHVLDDVKKEQDDALRPVADPKAGIVTPPPSFSVRFAGRRLDAQKGPRISFSGIPPTMVAGRLEAALLNAAYRDRHPPIGAWSGNAEREVKIPLPALSHVEIDGPQGPITAELPTRQGDDEALRRAVHEVAIKAAAQFEEMNRKGTEPDAKNRP